MKKDTKCNGCNRYNDCPLREYAPGLRSKLKTLFSRYFDFDAFKRKKKDDMPTTGIDPDLLYSFTRIQLN